MSKAGWIKLYRSIEDWEFYCDGPFDKTHAWIDMLIMANREPKTISVRGNLVRVERGEIGLSETTMAEKWGWSRERVRRFLRLLETRKQIRQQKNNILSKIIILNYENYQQIEQKFDFDLRTAKTRQQTRQQKIALSREEIDLSKDDYQKNETTDETTEKQQTRQQKKVAIRNARLKEGKEGKEVKKEEVTPTAVAATGIQSSDSRKTGESDPSPAPKPKREPRPPTPLQEVVQYFFDVKKWPVEGPEFRRYLRAGKDLLAVCKGDVALAKAKIDQIREWAGHKELSWSLDTVIKRWHELDATTASDPTPRMKATIEGESAYQNKRGDWMIVPRNGGPHVKWEGSLNAIQYAPR